MALPLGKESAFEAECSLGLLHRCPVAEADAMYQVVPLPLRGAKEHQLPPHLCRCQVQFEENGLCRLQRDTSALVSTPHMQEIVQEQWQQ
jgi:hypothetical protein